MLCFRCLNAFADDARPQIHGFTTSVPLTTEHFLDPASDEALVIKLAGLTRSLSPCARQLVLELDTPVLRKTVRFSEEHSVGRERDRVLTVKAWSRTAVEGICSMRVEPPTDERPPGEQFEAEDDLAGRSLSVRAQAMAAELGMRIPPRVNGALVNDDEDAFEDEILEFPDDEDTDMTFNFEVEDVQEVEEELDSDADRSLELLSPTSAVFHTHTLPLGPPPPGRRSPPLATPVATPTLSRPPPPRFAVQGLGPGWAEASRQSQLA